MSTYCAACAEMVAPSLDPSGSLARCSICGLGLGPLGASSDLDSLPEAEIEVILPVEEVVTRPLFGTVLVAEDTELFREILKDGLVAAGLAGHVSAGDNGAELLAIYSDLLYRRQAIDLAIIDLEMPLLDGASTAIALRAIEAGARSRRTPIIFFTAHAITDELRSVIHHCKPAHYLNKGADAQPARLLKRVREVMRGMQL